MASPRSSRQTSPKKVSTLDLSQLHSENVNLSPIISSLPPEPLQTGSKSKLPSPQLDSISDHKTPKEKGKADVNGNDEDEDEDEDEFSSNVPSEFNSTLTPAQKSPAKEAVNPRTPSDRGDIEHTEFSSNVPSVFQSSPPPSSTRSFNVTRSRVSSPQLPPTEAPVEQVVEDAGDEFSSNVPSRFISDPDLPGHVNNTDQNPSSPVLQSSSSDFHASRIETGTPGFLHIPRLQDIFRLPGNEDDDSESESEFELSSSSSFARPRGRHQQKKWQDDAEGEEEEDQKQQSDKAEEDGRGPETDKKDGNNKEGDEKHEGQETSEKESLCSPSPSARPCPSPCPAFLPPSPAAVKEVVQEKAASSTLEEQNHVDSDTSGPHDHQPSPYPTTKEENKRDEASNTPEAQSQMDTGVVADTGEPHDNQRASHPANLIDASRVEPGTPSIFSRVGNLIRRSLGRQDAPDPPSPSYSPPPLTPEIKQPETENRQEEEYQQHEDERQDHQETKDPEQGDSEEETDVQGQQQQKQQEKGETDTEVDPWEGLHDLRRHLRLGQEYFMSRVEPSPLLLPAPLVYPPPPLLRLILSQSGEPAILTTEHPTVLPAPPEVHPSVALFRMRKSARLAAKAQKKNQEEDKGGEAGQDGLSSRSCSGSAADGTPTKKIRTEKTADAIAGNATIATHDTTNPNNEGNGEERCLLTASKNKEDEEEPQTVSASKLVKKVRFAGDIESAAIDAEAGADTDKTKAGTYKSCLKPTATKKLVEEPVRKRGFKKMADSITAPIGSNIWRRGIVKRTCPKRKLEDEDESEECEEAEESDELVRSIKKGRWATESDYDADSESASNAAKTAAMGTRRSRRQKQKPGSLEEDESEDSDGEYQPENAPKSRLRQPVDVVAGAFGSLIGKKKKAVKKDPPKRKLAEDSEEPARPFKKARVKKNLGTSAATDVAETIEVAAKKGSRKRKVANTGDENDSDDEDKDSESSSSEEPVRPVKKARVKKNSGASAAADIAETIEVAGKKGSRKRKVADTIIDLTGDDGNPDAIPAQRPTKKAKSKKNHGTSAATDVAEATDTAEKKESRKRKAADATDESESEYEPGAVSAQRCITKAKVIPSGTTASAEPANTLSEDTAETQGTRRSGRLRTKTQKQKEIEAEGEREDVDVDPPVTMTGNRAVKRKAKSKNASTPTPASSMSVIDLAGEPSGNENGNEDLSETETETGKAKAAAKGKNKVQSGRVEKKNSRVTATRKTSSSSAKAKSNSSKTKPAAGKGRGKK